MPALKRLQNKQVSLTPLSIEQARALARETTEARLRELLHSALAAHRSHIAQQQQQEQTEPQPGQDKKPKQQDSWPWFTCWQIVRRSDGADLGWLAFCGPQQQGEIQLRGWLEDAATTAADIKIKDDPAAQALELLCQWAFGQDDTYFITSSSEGAKENWPMTLHKLDFQQSRPEQPSFWERERPASAWMSIFLCLGLSIGTSFGLNIFDNLAVGMCLGMAIGLCIGSALDSKDRQLRKKLKEARAQQGAEQRQDE